MGRLTMILESAQLNKEAEQLLIQCRGIGVSIGMWVPADDVYDDDSMSE
jgi:hypothetical protein